MSNGYLIPVGVSNRHIHLAQEHFEELFGRGAELTTLKNLSQKGEFAANETVTIVGPKGALTKTRIIGPVRLQSQVEISRTDSFKLGIKAPLRQSGKIEETPGCIIIGPRGIVTLKKGVILAERHIHMSPSDAQKFNVNDGDRVSVHADSLRKVTFHNVVVRVKPSFVLEFHVDTDEANAALLNSGDHVKLLI